MKLAASLFGIWLLGTVPACHALHETDTIMAGNSTQSGYAPNHNIDPTVVGSSAFDMIWKFPRQNQNVIPKGGVPDQFLAKTLVYTPKSSARQLVLAFSEANRIYALDAINGSLVASRDLATEGESPFKASDLLGCNDIGGTIGITGTPVIDPLDDTVYFWAKSYMNSPALGEATTWQQGAYRFHAVDATTLKERPGFPTNLQGAVADNDKTHSFTGGQHLQRASLNLINGVIFAGFGAHCDFYNYTGWVVGMDKAGKYRTGYVTMSSPDAPPQDGTWTGGGGGAGVWMAGSAISSDSKGRLFFTTGNGGTNGGRGKMVNGQAPASGRKHLTTLSECLVSLAIDPVNSTLSQQDYFQPSEYRHMDGADQDLGSGGACLPDPTVFSGGGVERIAITCGKNAKCYVVNADNLGGFKMGPAGDDAVIQILTPQTATTIYGNVGSYPLEGGYIYISPANGKPIAVFKLSKDGNGLPNFSQVAESEDGSKGAVGVGTHTITTFKGRPGTGILWVADPNGLRAYNAVPVNGKLVKINVPQVPSAPSKFQAPTFGDGRYYIPSLDGKIFAFGSPVATPLTCTAPLDFGDLAIGKTATLTLNCVANIAISKIEYFTIQKPEFTAQNSSLPKGSLSAGQSVDIPITFNLTNYVLNSGSTSAPVAKPGPETTALIFYTTNGVNGYSTQQSVSLTGTVISADPLLYINPPHLLFPGIVIGSAASTEGTTSSFEVQNDGQADLVILGYAYQHDGDGPFTNVTRTGSGPYLLDAKGDFSSELLKIGTTISASTSKSIDVTFNTSVIGTSSTLLTIFSNGGADSVLLSGSANTASVAVLESLTNEGGWEEIPNCSSSSGCNYQLDIGTASGAGTMKKSIRLSNKGHSSLIVQKSKPPFGGVIAAENPSVALAEGFEIPPGHNSTAVVDFTPDYAPLNSDPIIYSGTWILNTNDLAFGVHFLNFTGTLTARQVGPLLNNSNMARFKWMGCYIDGAGTRVEPTSIQVDNNSNGACQQAAITANAVFAGTEYGKECWVGSSLPPAASKVDDTQCTGPLTCPGDTTQFCGGANGFISLYYDSTRYNPAMGKFTGGFAPPSAPATVDRYKYAGCYSDNPGSRTLSTGSVGNAKTNSLEQCASLCKGSKYFGTEYATECFCGDTLAAKATLMPDAQCSMVCPGNGNQLCGAGNRLTLYERVGSKASSTTKPPAPAAGLPGGSIVKNDGASGDQVGAGTAPDDDRKVRLRLMNFFGA